MRWTALPYISLLVVVSLCAAADADEAPAVGETLVVGSDAGRALDEPAFVTVVEVPDSAAPSAAEIVSEVVGVNVRGLGGLGAFSSLSIRGAPSGQTAVLIDGVPVSRLAIATFDLSSLEVSTFDRIAVHRGGGLPGLHVGGLGGAVAFRSRVGAGQVGSVNRFAIGAGSYGARRASVQRLDTTDGGLDTSIVASYAGATGDYDYFHDGGTPVNLSDDSTRTRRNNQHDQLEGAARFRLRRPSWTLEGGERLAWKQQGLPGVTGNEALRTELARVRNIVDLGLELRRHHLDAGATGYFVFEQLRYQDPDGELGFGVQDSRLRTLSVGLSPSVAWYASAAHTMAARVDGSVESFERHSAIDDGTAVEPHGVRLGAAATLEHEARFAGGRWAVVPVLSWQIMATDAEGTGTGLGLDGPPDDRTDAALTGELGVRWRVTPTFTWKATSGRHFRPPTLAEAFGDRGAIVGNPRLRPERGWRADTGVVWAPGEVAYVEAALFASRTEDLITFILTGNRVARAENLSSTRTLGGELVASARLIDPITLSGNYTFLDSVQRSELVPFDGKRVPARPRHELYARLDVRVRQFDTFTDVTHLGGEFLDAGNLNEVPARTFVGAGASATWRGWRLALEARNLLGSRVETIDLGREVAPGVSSIPKAVSDSIGYPLPGRALYASLFLQLD